MKNQLSFEGGPTSELLLEDHQFLIFSKNPFSPHAAARKKKFISETVGTFFTKTTYVKQALGCVILVDFEGFPFGGTPFFLNFREMGIRQMAKQARARKRRQHIIYI